jgi:lipopolysaccharide biosynthesis glycosyltransferase
MISMMIPQIINKEYTLCFSLLFNLVQYVIYFDSDTMFCNVIVTVFSVPFRVEELAGLLTSSPSDAKFWISTQKIFGMYSSYLNLRK